MEICEQNKRMATYISRSFSSSPVYIYVFTYLYLCFVMAWRVFSCIIEWVEFWQKEKREREREIEKKSFLFSTQWKLCFNKKKQIPIIFSRKLEGNNILYVDFLDSKLLKKKVVIKIVKKFILCLSSLSRALSLFIN